MAGASPFAGRLLLDELPSAGWGRMIRRPPIAGRLWPGFAAAGCPLTRCTFVVEARPAPEEDTMKYLLQIYDGGATEQAGRLSADEEQAIVGEYLAIGQSPAVIGGEQLQSVETATTVRVQGGKTLLTDGPFVEAKEHLGCRSRSR
jgi:hypothetical protein